MVFQHLFGCEQLLADVAPEAVDLFVDDVHVVLPVALLGEGLVAILARKNFFFLVN